MKKRIAKKIRKATHYDRTNGGWPDSRLNYSGYQKWVAFILINKGYTSKNITKYNYFPKWSPMRGQWWREKKALGSFEVPF